MPLAEISFYSVVLFVQIAAVVLAFGVTFSFPIVMAVARKDHERHMGFFHRIQSIIGGRLIGPREERRAEMAERDIAASTGDGAVRFGRDYELLFAQARGVTLAINALILIAIFLMVTKPGA